MTEDREVGGWGVVLHHLVVGGDLPAEEAEQGVRVETGRRKGT